MNALQEKMTQLQKALRSMGSAAVAFSAGVDSTFLLRVAHDVLREHAAAVTVRSVFVPQAEQREAEAFCRENGIRLLWADVDVLAVDGVRQNPSDRCYRCKKALFGEIQRIAAEQGLAYVAEGSNADDTRDYRPGMRAIRELGIRSPLLEAGLAKDEIRTLSAQLGLPTWNKPAMACLATRFPTGDTITAENLRRVEQAEAELREMGFGQLRVRVHNDLARIETEPSAFARLLQPHTAEHIRSALQALGFRYVTLDLGGYQTGSMNDVLPSTPA